jgi:hypothetical protein
MVEWGPPAPVARAWRPDLDVLWAAVMTQIQINAFNANAVQQSSY